MKYKKEDDFSYALGATIVYELLTSNVTKIDEIYYCDKTSEDLVKKFLGLAQKFGVHFTLNNKIFHQLSDKENCYIIAKFKKYDNNLKKNGPDIVLVNPSNSGNLGTIIRSALGFDVKDIAIISPAVDIFDPKTIRASMGALFHCNIQYFASIQQYLSAHTGRKLYPFMLKATTDLREIEDIDLNKTTLIFGNEATGLEDSYLKLGQSVLIKHSKNIDSLNLQTAVSIALFHFTQKSKF